jgi:O-antigen/teichoic acid export membrane protein
MLLLPSVPAIESAAFYHLSMFSEITTYFLSPMIFVLFPLVAERHEKGEKTRRTLVQTMAVCIGVGVAAALALTWLGKPLFSLADATLFGRRPFGFAAVWKPYVPYTKYFGILALTAGLRMAMGCFGSHELACRRFRYAWYTVPLALFEALLIRLAYRYPQYSGYGSWHLGGVLAIMFAFTLLPLLCAGVDLALSYRRERTASTSSRI